MGCAHSPPIVLLELSHDDIFPAFSVVLVKNQDPEDVYIGVQTLLSKKGLVLSRFLHPIDFQLFLITINR